MTQEHYEWVIFLLGFGTGFGIAVIVARLVNGFKGASGVAEGK